VRTLTEEFDKLKPWVTKFVINGLSYGGSYDAANDNRVKQFFQAFPDAQIILELGSLEGGHTFALARHPNVKKVVGVEGRKSNIEKAQFIKKILGIDNVDFRQVNLEYTDLSSIGSFDAVFCVGVLYHLPKPWELLRKIPHVTKNLFVWTHYAPEHKANEKISNYEGMQYKECGLSDPLSGLSNMSFWLTLDSLKRILYESGFRNLQEIENNPDSPNGPSITLAAK
jgi:SAM-dependent methyltransferase